MRLQRFWKNCWLFPRELASSVPSDLLGGIRSFHWFVVCLAAHLVALPWDLACSSVPCDYRGLQIFRGNASLFPSKYAPYIILLSSCDVEGFGRLIPFPPTGFWGGPLSSCYLNRRG